MGTLQQDFLDWLDTRIAECNKNINKATCGNERWKNVDMQEAFEEVKEKFEEMIK